MTLALCTALGFQPACPLTTLSVDPQGTMYTEFGPAMLPAHSQSQHVWIVLPLGIPSSMCTAGGGICVPVLAMPFQMIMAAFVVKVALVSPLLPQLTLTTLLWSRDVLLMIVVFPLSLSLSVADHGLLLSMGRYLEPRYVLATARMKPTQHAAA
ncbi:hypothetical protein V8C86DRAFT_2767891 [Haematococcus lacustris]